MRCHGPRRLVPRVCRRVVILVVGLLALWLQSAPAWSLEKVVVGALPFVSSAPLFLAQEEGFYEREGLEVRIEFFRAAQPVALAVTTGDLDFGVTGLTAGFFNLAHRGGLRIIAAQAQVAPGFRFIAYCVNEEAWQAGFRSLAHYPGKRVGITQQGSTFHYMIGQLAEKQGFELRRVRLVPLESVPNMIAAVQGGSVDSILLPAHLALPLEGKGVLRILGWVGEETPWQLGAVFASGETLERRSTMVDKFLRAYRSGAALYADAFLQRNEAGERVFGDRARELVVKLQRYIPSTEQQILEGAPFIDRHAAISADDVRAQVDWFQEHRLVDDGLQVEALFRAGIGPNSRR